MKWSGTVWAREGDRRDEGWRDKMRNEEEVPLVLAGVVPGHRYPKTADCVERAEKLGMVIMCSQGPWIREIIMNALLPSRGATRSQRQNA